MIYLEGKKNKYVMIDLHKILSPYKNKNFIWYTLYSSLNEYVSVTKNDNLLQNIQDYPIFLFGAKEGDYIQRQEKELIEVLWNNNIDIEKVYIIGNNNLNNLFKLKYIYWEFFETVVRETPHKEVNILNKTFNKKFLCLNANPKKFRKDFIYKMKDLNILKYFNASLWNDKISLKYDKDYVNNRFGEWNNFTNTFSYENAIWIVTESVFNNDSNMTFLTEKTFKPILLKMPFIIIGQPYSLKKLKSLGYKTFSHLWDESYDNILDPQKRMNKIVELVAYLSTLDLEKIIIDNAHILEYNYKNLINSRAEKNLLEVIEKI